jgi:hypothetical protein
LPARTIAVRAAVAFRPLSTSAPLLKKSKAAATKKSQKQGKEHEEVEGGDKVRYEQSLEADADAILEKTQSKMEKSVEWAKGLVYDAVERGRGRVSPGEAHLGSMVQLLEADDPGVQPSWTESKLRSRAWGCRTSIPWRRLLSKATCCSSASGIRV